MKLLRASCKQKENKEQENLAKKKKEINRYNLYALEKSTLCVCVSRGCW